MNYDNDELMEDDVFDQWFNHMYKGDRRDREAVRAAWVAGRITGLRFGYAFTDESIIDELYRLGAI